MELRNVRPEVHLICTFNKYVCMHIYMYVYIYVYTHIYMKINEQVFN